MNNPFDVIDARLSNIESLLLELKHPAKKEPQVEEKDDLLTVQQAAELLDLTVPTIYSKVSRRELPAIKGPKRTYFSREELMAYLKRGRSHTFTEAEPDPVDSLKPRRKRA